MRDDTAHEVYEAPTVAHAGDYADRTRGVGWIGWDWLGGYTQGD